MMIVDDSLVHLWFGLWIYMMYLQLVIRLRMSMRPIPRDSIAAKMIYFSLVSMI
jgi:hypothetical protein